MSFLFASGVQKLIGSYLNSSDIGVLSNVLVLVETILRGLALAQINAQFHEEHHHWFEGRDGTTTSPLGGDMFVKDCEGGGSLAHSDEFLSPLWNNSIIST
jgi:hypothetical protein